MKPADSIASGLRRDGWRGKPRHIVAADYRDATTCDGRSRQQVHPHQYTRDSADRPERRGDGPGRPDPFSQFIELSPGAGRQSRVFRVWGQPLTIIPQPNHPRHHDYRVRERRIPTCCGEIVYPARRHRWHRCLRRHGWRLQDGRHDLSAEQRRVVSPQVEHGIWLFTQWVGPWASRKDPCGRSGNHRSLACPIASPHRAIASQLPAHT